MSTTAHAEHEEALTARIRAALDESDMTGVVSIVRTRVGTARVRDELARGRYGEALRSARESFDAGGFGLDAVVLPDVIEAAARSGDRAAAHAALDRFVLHARASGTAHDLGLLARSRAVLAGDDSAELWFEEALCLLDGTPDRFELARARLLYGEWLRRRRRRIEARGELRAAIAVFVTVGAVDFADRARTELLATGEQARRRSPATAYDLTQRERQVARLAAERLTNQEIAARLFISPSTVDYHLRKVFRKLGISSRRHLDLELARRSAAMVR